MTPEYRQILHRDARIAFDSVMKGPPGIRWQLWHAPGRLILLPAEQPVDGAEPVQGSTHTPWHTLTAEQFVMRMDELARRLPILTEGTT